MNLQQKSYDLRLRVLDMVYRAKTGHIGGDFSVCDILNVLYNRVMDVTLIACGELVRPALDAALLLEEKGISARVIDMYCVKPLDREAVLQAARETKAIVTAEEHSLYGSMVSQVVGESHPIPVKNLALPDEPAIAGKSAEVFAHYGLDA